MDWIHEFCLRQFFREEFTTLFVENILKGERGEEIRRYYETLDDEAGDDDSCGN